MGGSKKILQSIALLFLFLFSCKENVTQFDPEVYPLKVYPVVNSTHNNINLDDLYNSLARPEVCDQFIKLYSDPLNSFYQTVLITQARKKVDSLSLDLNTFNKCLDAAGINSNNDTCFYPLYFEEAIYNGKEVWNFGSVYEIDYGIIKVKDISSISVEKKTLKVVNVQNYIPLKPEVRKSNVNYDTLSATKIFSSIQIAKEFKTRYKNIYYMKLRDKIDESILSLVESLNEDKEEFRRWYFKDYILFSMWTLPCLVESAKFMGKDVWIIEIVYGENDYGHYHFFIIDKKTHEHLYHNGCL
ncbi:MAG: hypothetical protein FIA82_09990 [Melioribacter sp.]|nr:hypothetical protein [Melioribacter sp.]